MASRNKLKNMAELKEPHFASATSLAISTPYCHANASESKYLVA